MLQFVHILSRKRKYSKLNVNLGNYWPIIVIFINLYLFEPPMTDRIARLLLFHLNILKMSSVQNICGINKYNNVSSVCRLSLCGELFVKNNANRYPTYPTIVAVSAYTG